MTTKVEPMQAWVIYEGYLEDVEFEIVIGTLHDVVNRRNKIFPFKEFVDYPASGFYDRVVGPFPYTIAIKP